MIGPDAGIRIAIWENASRPEGRSEGFWAEAIKREKFGEPPPTDVIAILKVIKRRSQKSRKREGANCWCLDSSGAALRRASRPAEPGDSFEGAIILPERVHFQGAHLEGAVLHYARGLPREQLMVLGDTEKMTG